MNNFSEDLIRGFIYLNASKTPLLCKEWCNGIWIFYVNKNNQWVTLDVIPEVEAIAAYEKRLSRDQEKAYPDIKIVNK